MRNSPQKLLVFYGVLLITVLGVLFYFWDKYKKNLIPIRDYNEIKQEGILRITTEYDPLSYYIKGDTISGFQYEISRAIANIAGLEIETHLVISLSKSFQNLESNRVDIIARNIPITKELKENYLITNPLILNRQVLVQRKPSANNNVALIRNQLDLAGKTCYIPNGSPAKIRLDNMAYEISDTIHIIEEERYSPEQLIIMVAKGDIDYVVCDQQIAAETAKHFPEIDIQTAISFYQFNAWIVRKDAPSLRDSLNSWIKTLKERGIYQKIYKQYYDNDTF